MSEQNVWAEQREGTPPTLGQWITVSTDFMLLLSHILLRTYVFHKNSQKVEGAEQQNNQTLVLMILQTVDEDDCDERDGGDCVGGGN